MPQTPKRGIEVGGRGRSYNFKEVDLRSDPESVMMPLATRCILTSLMSARVALTTVRRM
jgi:hypothetical protein